MIDQNRELDETLADKKRARLEAQTDSERARSEAHAKDLAAPVLTPAEGALFIAIYYGLTIPPADLPLRAVREDCNPSAVVTEADCQVALTGCLAKGWLQVIDEPARTRIADELRKDLVIGPIYNGITDVGCVDFTDAGADLWKRLRARCPESECFVYPNLVHVKTAQFFRSSAAAVKEIQELRGQDDVVAVTGPTPIGPWRAQWWRRFPEGYRIDIEERLQWRGRDGGDGEVCYHDDSTRNADSNQLQHVLDRHNVTLAEWLLLESMEGDWFRHSAANLCRGAVKSGSRVLGVNISEEQCCAALEACLRYGWLRKLDQRTTDEVQCLLDDDPVLLALPRLAENRTHWCCCVNDPLRPGKLVHIPMPADWNWGNIDFSPAGAALYRMIAAEWLGQGWEDALRVARVYYWEEHHYSVAEEGFEKIVQEHVAKGDVIRSNRVVPIGPWCVKWWERFPAGYRLELELGEP